MSDTTRRDYLQHIGVLFLLTIVTLLLRMPFWFTDRFNWDESTFLLVGASILDGHLPYTVAWDIKPPFTFGWMALFLTVFGDSIVSVRIGGALFVLGTAFLVYLIALGFASRTYSILAGLVQIGLAGFYFGGQSTMSEHLATLPALLAIYAVMRGRMRPRAAVVIGIVVAIAVLSRMNMAYLAVALGLLILVAPGYESIRERLLVSTAYALGGLSIASLLALIYWLPGEFDTLWFSVYESSLIYSGEQAGMVASAITLAKALLGWGVRSPFLLLTVVGLSAAGAFLLLGQWVGRPDARYSIFVFFASLATLLLSILSSGGAHDHYALQLFPFISVFFAVALSRIAPRGKQRAGAITVTLLLMALSTGPTIDKARFLWDRHEQGLPLTHGLSFWAADLIRQQGLADYSIYAMERNLLYWLLDKPIPALLVTHPSNIVYPVLLELLYGPEATPEVPLREILAQSPTFIIRFEKFNYLAEHPEADAMLAQALKEYREIGRRDGLVVYMAEAARDLPRQP
jgi:4-amino-4-deoxy-L-arabinose transferase-like glycosyltransferase